MNGARKGSFFRTRCLHALLRKEVIYMTIRQMESRLEYCAQCIVIWDKQIDKERWLAECEDLVKQLKKAYREERRKK